jgi:hypothetical protein
VKNTLLRDVPVPMATPNVPPNCGASGSTRKPPKLSLKFGVNSIASASSLEKLFHFSQNSTVIAVFVDRSMLTLP